MLIPRFLIPGFNAAAFILLAGSAAAQTAPPAVADQIGPAPLLLEAEAGHLRHARQLTRGHTIAYAPDSPANFAEAYWAPDGKSLILQATVDEYECDQLFRIDLLTGALELIGTGMGRVTCGYFTGVNSQFVYASTDMGAGCPAGPDMSHGYVWPVYESYDIFIGEPGSPLVRQLTDAPGYDAEETVDWNTGWMYFTSTRGGDLDIWRMNLSTNATEQLTDELGYDGGPFVSYDGQHVVYRRGFPVTDEERADYSALLAQGLTRPGQLELMIMDADGTNKRQLTDNGAANFAPFLHPDNDTVIFCSNMAEPGGMSFDLYTLSLSTGAVEQITHHADFDGFPMFSPDGKYLVWCSNRNQSRPHETNVFVAEWLP